MKKLLLVLMCITLFLTVTACNPEDTSPRTGVLIYEIYTAGGYSSGENYAPYNHSYVVLYNSSNADVDLTGWSVQYCEDNSDKMVTANGAQLSGVIPASQFYVIEGGHAQDVSKRTVGEAINFKVNTSAPTFSPPRKSGVIALCNNKIGSNGNIRPLSAFVEDCIVYTDKKDDPVPFLVGTGPANGIGVKKILRRAAFSSTGDNSVDFKTKDIIDNPANVIRYAENMTSADVTALLKYADARISFSHEAGDFNAPFDLEITTTLADNPKIYYTLDGSAPFSVIGTKSPSAIEYIPESKINIFDRTGEPAMMATIGDVQDSTIIKHDNKHDYRIWPPVKAEGESEEAYAARLDQFGRSIFKLNLVRACAINDKNVITPIETNSYIVSPTSIKDRYNMPIMSIWSDREGLFGDSGGIFRTKFLNDHSADFDRPAGFQFIDTDGKLGVAQTFKLSLNGGATRQFPQKNLRVNMSYDKFDYDLFAGAAKDISGKPITFYDQFILRAGGNRFERTGLRNSIWETLCASINTFETQAVRPVTVFLNGEYWGTYHMIERTDKNYIASRFGVDKDSVVIVESFTSLTEGPSGGEKEVHDLLKYSISNDMSTDANYKRFTDVMDVDSYIDYFISEIYSDNTDWPGNNIRLWHSSDPNNAQYRKWRMIMQDVDLAIGFTPEGEGDSLNRVLTLTDEPAKMFQALMKNSTFKKKFVERFDELRTTVFTTDNIKKVVTDTESAINAAMPESRRRWQLEEKLYTKDLTMIYTVIENRAAIMEDAINKIR